MIGSIVQNRYLVERLLGEGGMGSVYLAQDLATGRPVALKVLSGASEESATIVERFRRESEAAQSIDSPHIARIFAAERDERGPFLVMEYLAGEDLGHLEERLHYLPPKLALRIVGQACAGLAKAHEAGVIHRDIKPANIFLAREEGGRITVKILDFGVAKVLPLWARRDVAPEVLTHTGTVLGSPLYMAPEQARGAKTVDHRADVWSMGVVLYQALAGNAPHHDIEAIGDLIVTICTQPPPPVNEVAPWVAPGLAAIVTRSLRLDPGSRFQSAGALREAILRELGEPLDLHESQLVRLGPEQRGRALGEVDPAPSAPRDSRWDTTVTR